MNRLRFSLLAAVCATVWATNAAHSAPVRGERSGLEQVPAKSPIVLHLRGVQGTRDRFVAMMEKALPEVLQKIQPDMDDFLKNGFMGRKLRGLAKDGPIFLTFTELPNAGQAPEGPPKFAIIVAVSDYKEFRDNVLTEEERKTIKVNGEGVETVTILNETTPTYFVDRKTFAVVTPNEEVANSFTKKQPGLDGKLSKEQAAKFLASDFGVYLNMDTLNKQYAEQFKEARKAIESGIDLFTQPGDESQKKAFEMFKKAIGPVFQTIEDTQGVLLTVEFRPGGLALHLEGEVRENSTTSALLQDSKPTAFEELERLPAGRTYYVGMRGSAGLYKGLGGLMSSLPGAGTEHLAPMMEEFAKSGPGILVGGLSFPLAGLNVYHFDDTAKAVAATLKMYRDMDPKTANLKGKPVVKTDAEQFGAFKLHYAQLAWDFDKMAEPIAAKGGEEAKKKFVESMKGMFGEKNNTWFGTNGKVVVQINAADWPAARKLLEQYSKGTNTAGDMKALRDVRKEMPARTSVLGLIDAVQMFGSIAEALKPLLGNQVPPNWPNKPDKDAVGFVGLAVTLQPRRGGLDLFISADAAKEFYKAVVKPFVGE
jgi:hypothetical protein